MTKSQNRSLADFAKDIDSAAVGSFFVTGSDSDKTTARPIVTTDISGLVTGFDSASIISLIDSSYVSNKLGSNVINTGSVRGVVDSANFNFIPAEGNTKSLGTSTKRWKNLYVKKLSFGGSFIDSNGIDGGDAKGISLPSDYSSNNIDY